MTRDDLLEALQSNNVQAFGMTVRRGESSVKDIAYTMRYGGAGKAPAYFTDLSAHPRIYEPTPSGQKSSAAGAYQATYTSWSEEQRKYGWTAFGRQEQDEFFVARLIYRKALDAVINGRFSEACRLCKSEWTSLPGGAEENSATKKALETYLQYGGTLAAAGDSPAPIPQEVTMAPIVLPILSVLAQMIPQLGAMFGSGSEVAQRNVAAGTLVAQKLVEVTNSVNLQEAAEKIQSDPTVMAEARAAVDGVMLQLAEVGGGIVEARKAAYAGDQVPFYKNPAFLIALILAPLIYMVAVEILFNPSGQTWSDDIKMMFVTAIVSGLLGSITGFFLGSSMSSQRKDAALGAK